MSNLTKNNKKDLLDIMRTKKIVSVAVIIAITGMFIFSNAFINPLLAQSSKSTDRKDSSKSTDGNDNAKTTTNTDTSSSSADKKDYKDFQKCLSTAEGTKGFATKTEIQDCFRQIYLPTSSSTTSTSPSTSSTSTT
jgi:ABC-type Na+ efflux pump permease subunit